MSYPKGHLFVPALLLALVLPLAGCSTTGDPAAAVVTAPGLYDLYDCPAIKVAAEGVVKRQRELEALMARANQGAGGGLVSATTYQPEYFTLRGKMNELSRVAAQNHCNFVPRTVEPPPEPVSALPSPAAKNTAEKKTKRY